MSAAQDAPTVVIAPDAITVVQPVRRDDEELVGPTPVAVSQTSTASYVASLGRIPSGDGS